MDKRAETDAEKLARGEFELKALAVAQSSDPDVDSIYLMNVIADARRPRRG